MEVIDAQRVAGEDLCLDPDALELRGKRREEEPYDRLSRELGLGRQPRVHDEKPRPSATTAAQLFPEWTGFRLEAWAAYLPTHYAEHQWRSYDYLKPDLASLQAIARAKDSSVFERIEIWTDQPDAQERTFLGMIKGVPNDLLMRYRASRWDPVAVGIVDNRYFPIAIWGPEEIIDERIVMRVGGFRAIRRRLIGDVRV